MAENLRSCGWETAEPIGGCRPEPGDEPGQLAYLDALAAAGEYLDRWTAGRYGVCPVEIYPCRVDPPPPGAFSAGLSPWAPALIGGQWYNLTCGYPPCAGSCLATCRHDFIRIPGPVAEVTSVTIGGEVLSPDAYRVVDAQALLRIDGGAWPTTQAYDGEGFIIGYDRGRPIPIGGLVALGSLACELYKALTGDKSCALPKRLQSITREGISMTLLDGFDSLDKGYTGLWEVDSWLASVNQSPRRGAIVTSPDYNFRGAAAQGVRVR